MGFRNRGSKGDLGEEEQEKEEPGKSSQVKMRQDKRSQEKGLRKEEPEKRIQDKP